MKWNATILVNFFQSARTDPNSSTKLKETLQCQTGSFITDPKCNWDIKDVPFFSVTHNTGKTRRPPSSFFSIVRLFPKKSQRVPLQISEVLRQIGCWRIWMGLPFFASLILSTFLEAHCFQMSNVSKNWNLQRAQNWNRCHSPPPDWLVCAREKELEEATNAAQGSQSGFSVFKQTSRINK